jgi:hypothetical protein
MAFLTGAVAIIVGHNHPSGTTQPSFEDGKITETLKAAGNILGIKILDHVIVTEDGFFSFADSLMAQSPYPTRIRWFVTGTRPVAACSSLGNIVSGDLAWGAVRRLTTILLWWQPLVWIIGRPMESASEELCDRPDAAPIDRPESL